MPHGGREQRRKRQTSACRLRGLKSQNPGADRARNREGREWAARRDALFSSVKLDACVGAGGARAHDGADAARRLANKEEAVAADVVHVRIDGRDRRRHDHHGFERITAFGEDQPAGFGSGPMRDGNDAATISGGIERHGG